MPATTQANFKKYTNAIINPNEHHRSKSSSFEKTKRKKHPGKTTNSLEKARITTSKITAGNHLQEFLPIQSKHQPIQIKK